MILRVRRRAWPTLREDWMMRAISVRECNRSFLLFVVLLVASCARSGPLGPQSQSLTGLADGGTSDGGGPVLSASPGTVLPGGTETVQLTGGPGNLKDWVGLYRSGDADTNPITWQYLSGTMIPPPTGMTSAT